MADVSRDFEVEERVLTLGGTAVIVDSGTPIAINQVAAAGSFYIDKLTGVQWWKASATVGDWVEVPNLKLNNLLDILKDFTGFTNNENIGVAYNSTTKKITLSGTFEAYWRGVKIAVLVTGWESAAIPGATPTTPRFLYYDGTNFVWSESIWTFDVLQICYVHYNAAGFQFAQREVHGFMPHPCHETDHQNIGTFLSSGGDLSGVVLGSTVAAQRRPNSSTTTICDEDLKTVLPGKTDTLYHIASLSGAGASVFLQDQAEFVRITSNNNPDYNSFQTPNWIQTPMANNNYMCMWKVSIPVTSDAASQKFRYLWIQGQSSGSLVSQQALTPQSLNLGALTGLSPEFVFTNKVIVRFTSNNWIVTQIDKLTGSKAVTVSTTGGFLSTVSTDTSLTGHGTVLDPLVVNATPYTLLAGRNAAVGQTVNGGTLTAQSLRLQGNAVDTHGLLLAGTGKLSSTRSDYDTLITADADIPNRKYLHDQVFSAGIYTEPTVTINPNGTVTLGSGVYITYADANFSLPLTRHTIPGATYSFTDNATNYIVFDSTTTPGITVSTNRDNINQSCVIPVLTVYREGNELHTISWDSLSKGLSNKLADRAVRVNRYEVEPGGLVLSEAATRSILTTDGYVWVGAARNLLGSFTSVSDSCELWYHSSSAWTKTAITQYNNTQYDDGADLVAVGVGRYCVNWIYRGVETTKHAFVLLGGGSYKLSEAQASQPPVPPSIIASQAILIGRILVEQGTDTAYEIQSALITPFNRTPVTDHTELSGLTTTDAGHTQFALLAGRAGGQTVTGSTLTAETLILKNNAVDNKIFTIEGDGTLSTTTATYEALVLNDNDIPNRKFVTAGYEPIISSKGSAFNLNLGSAAGTVAEGDKVALLGGRNASIGQTIKGGTATTQRLALQGNAADTTTGGVDILSTTASSSTTTGALTVAGGVGIAKKLYVAGDTVLQGELVLDKATAHAIVHQYNSYTVAHTGVPPEPGNYSPNARLGDLVHRVEAGRHLFSCDSGLSEVMSANGGYMEVFVFENYSVTGGVIQVAFPRAVVANELVGWTIAINCDLGDDMVFTILSNVAGAAGISGNVTVDDGGDIAEVYEYDGTSVNRTNSVAIGTNAITSGTLYNALRVTGGSVALNPSGLLDGTNLEHHAIGGMSIVHGASSYPNRVLQIYPDTNANRNSYILMASRTASADNWWSYGVTTTNTFIIGNNPDLNVTRLVLTTTGGNLYGAGVSSTCLGEGAVASGQNDVSLGCTAHASGTYGVVIGNDAHSSAICAVAVGASSAASSTNAIAIGRETKASGANSIGMGYHNASVGASGANAVGIGLAVVASGTSAVAIGNAASAVNGDGLNPTAVGERASAAYYGSAFGSWSVATGYCSVALGREASATGEGALAIGYKSITAGVYALSIGHDATASAGDCISIGREAATTYANAIAIGYFAKATGNGHAIALGYHTEATGDQSLAIGYDAHSNHAYSTAIGAGSVRTSTTNQMMLGTRYTALAVRRESDDAVQTGWTGELIWTNPDDGRSYYLEFAKGICVDGGAS